MDFTQIDGSDLCDRSLRWTLNLRWRSSTTATWTGCDIERRRRSFSDPNSSYTCRSSHQCCRHSRDAGVGLLWSSPALDGNRHFGNTSYPEHTSRRPETAGCLRWNRRPRWAQLLRDRSGIPSCADYSKLRHSTIYQVSYGEWSNPLCVNDWSFQPIAIALWSRGDSF